MSTAAFLASLAARSFAQEEPLSFDAPVAALEVVEGPVLLSAAIAGQWGGHTFSYVVEGESAVFWTARRSEAGPALVGQHPEPGSGGA
ncbi:MAG: hypothetical protein ACREIU_12490, partial [Planctomycetota bacterium]